MNGPRLKLIYRNVRFARPQAQLPVPFNRKKEASIASKRPSAMIANGRIKVFDIWVSGAESLAGPEVEADDIKLVPDRKDYKAGDVAELLVQAPFYPAEGLLIIQRSGILNLERFRMDQPTTTLRVPIEEGWSPNVVAQVDLLGEVERDSGEPRETAPEEARIRQREHKALRSSI